MVSVLEGIVIGKIKIWFIVLSVIQIHVTTKRVINAEMPYNTQ